MKKYLLLAVGLCGSLMTQAQFIYDASGKPVNIYQIIQAHKDYIEQHPLRTEEQQAEHDKGVARGKDIDESGDYQYQRWLWYWRQHTDENGFLISPTKIWDEWKANKSINPKNAKLTSGNPSNWKFQGPDTPTGNHQDGLGRISALAFHPTNANTYWVGADGGGAWKTTDDGNTWTPMTDNMPTMVVSDIDINPLNPNTIYLCTGDRDHGGWDNHLDPGVGYGQGVYKSYDGGATWDTTGMKWSKSALQVANCLVINPQDTNSVILATSKGIYKSMNGGATWTQKSIGNFKQLLYSVNDTSVVFATSYVDAGGSFSAQIFRSKDNGETWTQVTSFSKILRITLAVTPADKRVVKALTSSSDVSGNLFGIEGVYNSTDTGKTFTRIFTGSCSNNILDWNSGSTHSCGGQGMYDLMLAIDPTNASNVYVGGINAWYSTNGGASWTILTQWNSYASGGYTSVPVVHADKHVAIFHPLVPGKFFECNDGGIYTSSNVFSGSSTWTELTRGLGITEFYSVAVSPVTPLVVGGAQDNGTMAVEFKSMGMLTGGDGMACQQDPTDSNTIYTSYVNGVIYSLTGIYTGFSYDQISNNITAPGPAPVGAWLTPFLIQPKCNYCLITGYDQVYYSNFQGAPSTWSSISPVFLPGTYISNLGVCANDSQTIYAVSSDTNVIHATFNMGGSWSTITGAGPGIISGIEVDPKSKTHIWVTYSGFGTKKVAEYKPFSGWKNLNGNLPNIPINCIKMDTATRILYIGTDLGVYYKNDTSSVWQVYNNGLPNVRISQLDINYTKGELWAATYGRGMWASPKATTVNNVASTAHEHEAVMISPNPNKGNFNLKVDAFYGNKRVDIRLMDNMGRTAWTDVLRFDGSGKTLIQTSGLAKGIYFMEAACENDVIAREKIVVE